MSKDLINCNRKLWQELALTHGLIYLGESGLDFNDEAQLFEQVLDSWIEFPSALSYLRNHSDVRKDPRKILESVKSIHIFALPYGEVCSKDNGNSKPKIAKYALMPDYHRYLKKKLGKLAEEFSTKTQQIFNHRVAVDSAPFLERAAALKTNAGFMGKNTCFIGEKTGSFVLLASLLTDLTPQFESVAQNVFAKKNRKEGGCGTCKRCQVHCPTGALDKDYHLEPSLCLSYWTIENKDVIPEKFWPHLKKYYFGCDICQDVCPYNRDVNTIKVKSVRTPTNRKLIENLDLFLVATMDQKFYEDVFGGTAMTRAKREGLMRNALIAMYEIRDERFLEALQYVEDKEKDNMLQKTCRMLQENLNK